MMSSPRSRARCCSWPAFARQELAPGKTATVSIAVPAQRLQFLGTDLSPVFEPGVVEILVGPRANRADLLVGTVLMQAG